MLGEPDSRRDLLRIDPQMLRDIRVTTARVEVRPMSEGVTALGELRVNEQAYAEVGSLIAARVMRLLAAAGDAVQAGQELVELESAELGRARAEYLQAQAKAELARRTLTRARGLAGERIVPERERQEAEAMAAAADAALRAARAGLRALGAGEADLDAGRETDARFVLRAPIAGTVLERNVVQGQLAEPAHPLFRVADLSRLWLVTHAYERDAVRVRVGGTARVAIPALPGRGFSGAVTFVGRQVDVASRTIPVRVEIDNADGLLRPGMSATAQLPLGDAAATLVSVPAASLQRLADGWHVFLPRGEAAFEVRGVGRGRDLGGEVEILSGLQAGDEIVVDGAFLLKAEADKRAGAAEQHAH